MSDFYLIWKNISRNKLRLILNTFAIVIAFLLFGVLGAINNAFNAGVELSADNRLVVVNKINFTQPMPISYVAKIAAVEGVKEVTHANWFGAYVEGSKIFFAGMAVDPETYLDVYADFMTVPDTQHQAWQQNRQGVLVGEKLAETFGWKIGDRIPISSNIFSKVDGTHVWDMVVEGIFTGAEAQIDTNFLLFHYKYFIETQTFGSDWIGWIVLTTDNPNLNDQVANGIDEQFANSAFETETSSEKQFNKSFLEQIGSIGLILTSVVAAAFFTLLLIVGNSMALAIRERTREIAVLKTLGFSAQHVFRLVLSESVMLALIGGVLGLLLANMIVNGLGQVPQIKNMLPSLVLNSKIFITAFLYMLALGLLTGVIPAYRAMQLNIVEALSRK
jgi:putative ABC transport system permease protein